MGGKSYAPTSEHPFYPYIKQLTELVEFMEKLQNNVEDAKRCEDAAKKLVSAVKNRVLTGKAEHSLIGFFANAVERCGGDYSKGTTPKRSVSSGGSLVGRDNLKMISRVTDILCIEVNRGHSIHELLDKIPPRESATPLNVISLPKLYKTPPEENEAEVTAGEAEVKGQEEPPLGRKAGAPKFRSTLAWAPETSPIIADSPPAMDHSPSDSTTPVRKRPLDDLVERVERDLENEGLKKAKADVEDAIADAKASTYLKPKRKKAMPKRSILKDIANMKEFSDNNLGDDKTKPLQPKVAKEVKKADKVTKDVAKSKSIKASNPKPKKKKEIVQVKGQTKMTSYFRL